MSSAEEPLSIISYEENCPQTLKPENTFVFVFLSAQKTLENGCLAAAVSALPPLAVSSGQHPSGLHHLENQQNAACARNGYPPKPGHPFLAKLSCPVITGEHAWPPYPREGVDRSLAERTPAASAGEMTRVMWAAPWDDSFQTSNCQLQATCFSRAQLWIKAADQHWSNHYLCVLWGALVWKQPEWPQSPCRITYPRGQVSLHWTSVCATLHRIFTSRPLPWTQAKLVVFHLSPILTVCGLHIIWQHYWADAWQAAVTLVFLADAQENPVFPYGILKAAANQICSVGINQKPCN